MKNIFSFALMFFSLSIPCISVAEDLIPYPDGKGRWGYCDKKSDIKIPPRYDAVRPFTNGTGIGFRNPYTVFISTDGTEILKGRWQDVRLSDNHGFPVKIRGLWGYSDPEGRIIFPAEYDEFYNFHGDYAPVRKDGTYGFVNFKTGAFTPCGCDSLTPFSGGYAVFGRNGRYGLFDSNAEEVFPPAFEELYPFSGGFATARLNGKYGFVTDKLLFKERDYIRIWPFSGGFAAASALDSDNKCGYIDHDGTVSAEFIYAECGPFSEGMAAVRKTKNGKWGYIDTKGREMTEFTYDHAWPFINGAAWTVIGEKGIWINNEGRPYDKFFKLKKITDRRIKKSESSGK